MLLDFSRRREIDFKIKLPNEEERNYSGVVTAEIYERIVEFDKKYQDKLQKQLDLSKIKFKNNVDVKKAKEIGLNDIDLTSFNNLINDNFSEDKKNFVIKTFLSDKYEDYINDTKQIRNAVDNALYGLIIDNIIELENDLKGGKDEDEGK